MKQILLLVLIGLSCVACSPCYQIYQVKTSGGVLEQRDAMVFEDQNCTLSYDFWSKGGEVAFSVYNKTDKQIFIDLSECFFVMNGVANDYFLDRTYLTHTSAVIGGAKSLSLAGSTYGYPAVAGVAVSAQTGVSKGVEYKEQKIVPIPPKSRKIICEYKIAEVLFQDCDLSEAVTQSNPSRMTFSETISPYKFENRLVYQVGGEKVAVNNNFYVSDITNMPERSALSEGGKPANCRSSWDSKAKVFKVNSPSKFYLIYGGSLDAYRSRSRPANVSSHSDPLYHGN